MARSLHKLMAYKDESEVARLHLDAALGEEIRSRFGPSVRVRWHLHPPLLRALGLKKKIKLGAWFAPAFQLLRAMKGLRGTALDVFGYAEVRRVERALPGEYRQMVETVLARLTPDTHDLAVQIGELPDDIRGYESIKLESVKRFREAARQLSRSSAEHIHTGRHSTVRRLLIAGAAVVLAGCAGTMVDKEAPAPLSAEATLKDKDGKQVGVATLIETPAGVRVAVTGYRLPPGTHGLHIHAVGSCQPPDFTSAGAHFNLGGKKHGRRSPEGPHAGDLPNLVVGAAAEGGIDVTTKLVTLGPGPGSLLGERGTSVVIHAGADDEQTDPTGNSGGRIACGVIVK